MGERAATHPAVGGPPRGTPARTLDQAPLSQEYFSVPDNYLGPKMPIGIMILEACDALLPGAGPGLIPRDVDGMISLPIRLTGHDHLMAALLCGLSGNLHFLMRAVSSITLTCSRAVT